MPLPQAFPQHSAYTRVDLESRVLGASPHQLIGLLFDELLRNITLARQALAQGDGVRSKAAIDKSIRVIEDGLKPGLHPSAAASLTGLLRTLYDAVVARLTLAKLRRDDQLLQESAALVEPVRQAWQLIGPAPAARAA